MIPTHYEMEVTNSPFQRRAGESLPLPIEVSRWFASVSGATVQVVDISECPNDHDCAAEDNVGTSQNCSVTVVADEIFVTTPALGFSAGKQYRVDFTITGVTVEGVTGTLKPFARIWGIV